MKCLYIKSIPFGKNAAGGGITHTIGLIQGFLDADTDITIITSCPFDIDNDKTVCLNVPYKKNSLPFIRDYLFFRAYKKALVQWLKNNDQKYDFVYCRNRGFSDLPLVASKIKKSYMILEVNDIVHKTVWDLVLYPNMKKHSKIVAPLFYFSNFILEHLIKRQ